MRVARALVLLAAAGCGHAPPPGPAAVLLLFRDALDGDDPHTAYGLLAASVRTRLPEAEFTTRWRAASDDRRDQAARLRRPPQTVDLWAAVLLADGASVPLLREPAGWRLTSTALGELRAATPDAALRLLARALEARRFDLLLGILADPLRSEVERQLRERLERLKAALDKGAEVEVIGDRANLQYDSRFHIELRRQDGEWRIHGLN